MKEFAQAIADGFNELGYEVHVPNEAGETKFGPECHEVQTIVHKLNRVIQSWPTVYDGNSGFSSSQVQTWSLVKYDDKNYTTISLNFTNSRRQAKLAFIEEIVKEPCKHEPDEWGVRWKNIICKHCGVELQETWSEKK